MTKLKISAVSINTTPLDTKGNFETIKSALLSPECSDSDIVLFPELSITGYGCEDAFFKAYLWDSALTSLEQIKNLTTEKLVLVGLPLFFDGFLYNCMAVLLDGKIRAFVPKMHLANTGVHYETRWFHSESKSQNKTILLNGNTIPFGNFIFQYKEYSFAIEICEDSWNHFKPSLTYAEQGIDILLSPGASHFSLGKQNLRKNIFQEISRSQNNLVVYTNLNGNESGRIIFEGGSLFCESGKLLQEGKRLFFSEYSITNHTTSLESIRSRRAREFRSSKQNLYPTTKIFLEPAAKKSFTVTDKRELFISSSEDREPELSIFEEFTKAVSLGLFDYLRKSKTKGYTLSLSGGADSAICALLVVAMKSLAKRERSKTCFKELGLDEKNLLVTIYQKTVNNSSTTEQIAALLSEELQIPHHNISIDGAVKTSVELIESAIQRKLDWKTDDLAMQNIQARVRSPLVWLLANLHGHLLISTGNRSEASVGYTTMDGDSSGSVCPISGVSKEFLLEFLDDLQSGKNRFITPKESIRMLRETKPTAELRPLSEHQEDEKDLMPYPILQKIEECIVYLGLSEQETKQRLTESFPEESESSLLAKIQKFKKLFMNSQWKRERLPPGFHLDAYGIDPKSSYRFPILSKES
ncbi:MAG: NAD(+) synthase [Leptospira sp.]|nr:NAD(+) synthase [Leptospira sp.]